MSKAHDPHWRYVAVRLTGTGCSRSALGSAIKAAAKAASVEGDLPQLTRFEWPHAIVKMHHFQLADSRNWLPALRAPGIESVATLSASGTIRTLTDRLDILQERGPKQDGSRKAAPARPGRSVVSGGPARPPGRVRRGPPSRHRDHRS